MTLQKPEAVVRRCSVEKVFLEYQQMNIYLIILVKKIQEFDVIQVLFKSSSIFQRFDWYNSYSQGEDVEWKICITV